MVNPYSAGTLTLQEAPSFAWRTNGLPLNRERRGTNPAANHNRDAPLVGCSVLLGGLSNPGQESRRSKYRDDLQVAFSQSIDYPIWGRDHFTDLRIISFRYFAARFWERLQSFDSLDDPCDYQICNARRVSSYVVSDRLDVTQRPR